MKFADSLFAPVYAALGNVAVFTLADGVTTFTLRALDKSAGIEVAEGASQLATIRPAAIIIMRDLLALNYVPSDLQSSTMVLNGTVWKVRTYYPKPTLNGEADGELYLILSEAA